MKRIVAGACAVALAATLGACGQQANDTNSQGAQNAQSTQEQAQGSDQQGSDTAAQDESSSGDSQSQEDQEAGKLPAYDAGETGITAAICERCTADLSYSLDADDGGVWIPVPHIYKVDDSDSSDIKVWLDFELNAYTLKGTVLEFLSGGSNPALAHLSSEGDSFTVTNVEYAGDGAQMTEDVKRFSEGDAALEADYLGPSDGAELSEWTQKLADERTECIRSYVEDNNLTVSAYQDASGNPVSL